MINEVIIDDIFGISVLLTEQKYRPDLDRYRSLSIIEACRMPVLK